MTIVVGGMLITSTTITTMSHYFTVAIHYITPSIFLFFHQKYTGHIAQSVTCLATDANQTADPGVASSIPARSHTFVEIDHEIFFIVILLLFAESFKKG